MTETIVTADLHNAFRRLMAAAPELPYTHLQLGSKLYGNSFTIHQVDPEHGGHSHVQHLGFTKREAYDRLQAMTRAIMAYQDATGVRRMADNGDRFRVTDTHQNGAVNVALTLTYTAGSTPIARSVADDVRAALVRTAGTAHVPAVRVQS